WLQRVDVADVLAPLQQIDVEVRDADPSNETVVDELPHRLPRLFDRGVRVRPMKLVQVDHFAAQPLQALLRSGAYVGRVEAGPIRRRRELREHQHVRVVAHRLSNELFGAAPPVHLSGVDPRHPRVEPGLHRFDDVLVFRARAPELTTRFPRAETHDGDYGTVLAELLLLHRILPITRSNSPAVSIIPRNDRGEPPR